MVGRDDAHLAEGAGGEDLADADHVGQVARPHRLHGEQAFLGGAVADERGLGRVEGEGLLDKHVLAVIQRQQGVVDVTGVRGRDVDDVDVGVGHELLVRTVGVRDVVLFGERASAVDAARADGGDVSSRRAQVGGEGVGDAARREDAPVQSGHGIHRIGARRPRGPPPGVVCSLPPPTPVTAPDERDRPPRRSRSAIRVWQRCISCARPVRKCSMRAGFTLPASSAILV